MPSETSITRGAINRECDEPIALQGKTRVHISHWKRLDELAAGQVKAAEVVAQTAKYDSLRDLNLLRGASHGAHQAGAGRIADIHPQQPAIFRRHHRQAGSGIDADIDRIAGQVKLGENCRLFWIGDIDCSKTECTRGCVGNQLLRILVARDRNLTAFTSKRRLRDQSIDDDQVRKRIETASQFGKVADAVRVRVSICEGSANRYLGLIGQAVPITIR
jgi:hypothetical protein